MTAAHLTLYGPNPTDPDGEDFGQVAHLYTEDGPSPEEVLPIFDVALNSVETSLYGLEGFVWHILPSPNSAGDGQDWRFTDMTGQVITDGWRYTVNFNGDRQTVTVEETRSSEALPVALYAEAEGGLLANYEASR